jgi:hypothetical protein
MVIGASNSRNHGQREIAVVAITVIEGERGEAPRELALRQPRMHLVHGNEIDVVFAQMLQGCAQEFRLDLEMTVGLEFGVAPRADMVQHENGADTCEDGSQQVMHPGPGEHFQSGPDNGVAELLHYRWWPVGVRLQVNG